jgi:hypothetical protein
VIGALDDCCASSCPLSFDLAPPLLAGLNLASLLLAGLDLELVLLEAAMLVAADTAHHSAAD